MSNYEIWSLIISGISAFFGVGSFIAVWRIFCKTNQLTQRSKKGDKSQYVTSLMAQILTDTCQCIELSQSRFLSAMFEYKALFRQTRSQIKMNGELLRLESHHKEWYSEKQMELMIKMSDKAEEIFNIGKDEKTIDKRFQEEIKAIIEEFDKVRDE